MISSLYLYKIQRQTSEIIHSFKFSQNNQVEKWSCFTVSTTIAPYFWSVQVSAGLQDCGWSSLQSFNFENNLSHPMYQLVYPSSTLQLNRVWGGVGLHPALPPTFEGIMQSASYSTYPWRRVWGLCWLVSYPPSTLQGREKATPPSTRK